MKELENKKLLILGGFNLACVIVRHAQDLGAYVIVADYNPNAMAKDLADKFVLVSATDVSQIVNLCKEEHVDGIATGFVDILLRPCYEACLQLGLPCYFTPKMLSMSTNKVDFKETCHEYGVPVPQTYYIGSDIPEEVYSRINYPVFVKPLDASGSRGAAVCRNREELNNQFPLSVSYSESKNAIIEDYITGREFLLNYIAQDGEFRLISMFDRYAAPGRGSAINYASLSTGPSKAIEYYLSEINPKVVNMFKSLGFKDGLYFMQGYSDGKKITFFEMGCRLGGSYYDLEKKCIDCDPVDMTVRYALTGKMTDDIMRYSENVANYKQKAVCINYLLEGRDETIAKIEGIEKIEAMSSFVKGEKRQFVGDHFKMDTIVDKPVYSAYMVMDNKEQLIRDVEYMNSVFVVENKEGKSLLSHKFDPNTL